MSSGHRVYHTGFGDQPFEIKCNNKDAYSIADFLFLDFPGVKVATSIQEYDTVYPAAGTDATRVPLNPDYLQQITGGEKVGVT
jgi:hypothetical protein